MDNIKKIEIDGESLFIKKSKIFGWGFVYPIKIDGKLNWKNILIGGSWFNVIKLLVIILLLAGCLNEYSNAINVANECLNKTITVILP
jgi:hypothetical protein